MQLQQYPDLSEVRGQTAAKRALIVATANAHNLLFSGPPGKGETLLASLHGLLPPLNEGESLELSALKLIPGYAALISCLSAPLYDTTDHSRPLC